MNRTLIAIATTVAVATSFRAFAQETAEAAKFGGLFGVKFGTIISSSKQCSTNDSCSLVYQYTPEQKFNEFSEYLIFASPKTRTVYQVRAAYLCSDKEDAKAKIDEIVPILEAKFGRNARKLEDGKIIRFPNGDRIQVIQANRLVDIVVIDAVSGEFSELDDEESKQIKADMLKANIAALQILPKQESGEKVMRITGLFGRNFGDKLSDDRFYVRNKNESLVDDFEVEKEFMGFAEYKAFATPESREVFMFRAVYTGDDNREVRDKVVSFFEQVFGKEAMTDNEGDKVFIINGKKGNLVQITLDNGRVFLDVSDIMLYMKAEEQEKARKRKRFSSEMDAL